MILEKQEKDKDLQRKEKACENKESILSFLNLYITYYLHIK